MGDKVSTRRNGFPRKGDRTLRSGLFRQSTYRMGFEPAVEIRSMRAT
jgi:hypothetical protein